MARPNFEDFAAGTAEMKVHPASEMMVPPDPARKDDQPKTLLSQMENEQEMIDTVLAKARYFRQYREPFEDRWKRGIMAMFQQLTTTAESSWQSKRFMPMIQTHVETAQSVICTTFFGGEKIISCKGRTMAGKRNAEAHEALLAWQLKGPVKFDRKIVASFWWALVTGTAIADVSWSRMEADRTSGFYDEETKTKKYKTEKTRVEDWPVVRDLVPTDVFLPPDSERGADHEEVVLRWDTTIDAIMEAAEQGSHIDKVAVLKWLEEEKPQQAATRRATFDPYLGTDLWHDWLEEIGRGGGVGTQNSDPADKLDGKKLITLLVYKSKTEFVTLGSDKHVIGYSKNPYHHGKTGIVTGPFKDVPGCPYGLSLADALLGSQELLNENVNLFSDVSKLSYMRPMIQDRSLINILDEDRVLEPNALLRAKANAREALVPVDIPAPTNLFQLFDASLKREADDVSGFTEQARGISPAGAQTATEYSGTQTNIQNRLRLHILRFQWFIEDVVGMIVQLNEQFYDQAQVVTVVGEEGIEYRQIEPWEIFGDISVTVNANPARANPDAHAMRMIQLTNIILPMLTGQVQMTPTAIRWVREVLKASNVEIAGELFPPVPRGTMSPEAENAAMENGLAVHPNPIESVLGLSQAHVASHSRHLSTLDPESVPPEVFQLFQDHIAEHAQQDAQVGMAAAQKALGGQGGVPGSAAPGVDPVRAGATELGSAQGAAGIPGQSSPGPVAPLGRPI